MTRVPIIQTQAFADNGNPYTKTRAGKIAGTVGLGALTAISYTREYKTPEFRKDFVNNLTQKGKYYSQDEIISLMKRAAKTSTIVAVMIYAGVGYLIGSLIDNNINMKNKSEAEDKKAAKKP